jgi:acyl-CoA hydrolase
MTDVRPAMPGRNREITLRFLAEPTDVNFGGKMFGGSVMKWIDLAGYACATGWSGRYCVTAYVGGIQFEHPISIGSLVEARARLLLTGRTSMHIAVTIYSRMPTEETSARTTHCLMVFVAIDELGRPTQVPSWQPVSPEDQAQAAYAERMKALSLEVEAERARIQTG